MPERARGQPRSALWELTVARILEALRDPTALFWTFVFPIFVALGLGAAFRPTQSAPQSVALACAEGAACAELETGLSRVREIALQRAPLEPALADLRRGKHALVLELELELAATRSAEGSKRVDGAAAPMRLSLHFDPSRPEAQLARLAVEARLGHPAPGLTLSERPRAERGGRYVDYLMPGLVALNLMGTGVWGIGLSIVDQRKRRLMRQLATTPMRRSDYLLAYMLSRLVFLIPEVALLFGFGVLAFDVPMRGSWAAIAAISVVGAFAFCGLGVLVAARVASAEAAAGWANLVMMPMWLLSGVFFSYAQFPDALRPVIRALPLTALADALRAVTLESASLGACATELAVLALWAALSFGLALRFFRWQ